MPMGGDFRYVDASMWFTNMDKYIKYINQDVSIFIKKNDFSRPRRPTSQRSIQHQLAM